MSIVISEERPDSEDGGLLIAELDATLAPHYPAVSRHGYSVEKLLREQVTFFVACQEGTPAGCGGVQFFGTDYAEVKRMFVRPNFRGLGVGKQILNHIVDYTQRGGITVLRLETGIFQEAAIRLYEAAGFQRIPPFGHYTDDPVSLCFEKLLK